jgi:hypothetical protein
VFVLARFRKRHFAGRNIAVSIGIFFPDRGLNPVSSNDQHSLT